MPLQTKRLVLADLSLDYLDQIHLLHSLPETDKFNTLGIPESIEVTKNVVMSWLKKQQEQPKTSHVFCIHLHETSQFIGLIGLKIGKPNYRNAEIWYKTHPGHWNKGYTTEALFEILEFAFFKLSLHRIEAGCAVDNIASIKVLEKTGMIREGRKRKILPIRGEWIDNYFYSILENEFKRPQVDYRLM